MRVLCLHGMGTNNDVFAMQTLALRAQLGCSSVHKFEFVEGNVEYPAAPGISTLFPSTTGYWAYFDPSSASSILQAIEDLAAYIASEGPFDGVMAFSQGAALAAMLLARPSLAPVFTFAIFICAGAPYCEKSLRRGVPRFLSPEKDGAVINVPTAHIIGRKDDLLGESIKLIDLCADGMTDREGSSVRYGVLKKVFDHGRGHEVPVAPHGVTENMAQCVQDIITKASYIQ
ncbi:hypothetical protein NA57DRAFT_81776 [Rhizodiscina lignyota]|uniref:Serine hydrolase domain-containing protein n=1 Tax=Rhizodiscina lignyota TaxID=1504668 RepID=A0A9P4I4P1_9PEZI|nr:hypothetical protein NA57DRAFT_81776 [Rhizodiscina lignyota]